MPDSEKKFNSYLGIVTAVIGILTYATSAYFEYQHKRDIAAEHKLEVSNTNLTELLSKQQVAYQQVVSAITKIRQVRTDILLTCKRFPEKINDKQFLLDSDIAIYAAGYNLILAQGLADFVFVDAIRNQIKEFNVWEISTTADEICSGKAPSDREYEKKQTAIESVMQKTIQDTKEFIK